jgi:hypothetical protein
MYPIAQLSASGNASIPLTSRNDRNPGHDYAMPYTLLSDDEQIARLLIDTWTLTTGKTLRSDVPPHELAEDELIEFWSDDLFDIDRI